MNLIRSSEMEKKIASLKEISSKLETDSNRYSQEKQILLKVSNYFVNINIFRR